MRERISASADRSISCTHGTRVSVSLPAICVRRGHVFVSKAPASALITDKREVDAPPLLAAYPDHHLARLRAVLFHTQSFNAAVPDILTSGVLTRSSERLGCHDAVLHRLRPVSLFPYRQRPIQRSLFYGHRLIATGVVNILFVLHLAMGLCGAVGAERLFRTTPVCAFGSRGICRVLNAAGGRCEHRAQRRRG